MSYCTCIYDGASDNWPVHFWPTQPKARKEHKCCECSSVIQVGEQYHRDKGVWENGFFTFKVCVVCREITDAFFCEGFAYEKVIDALYEHIRENNGEISEKCIANLSPAARAQVCSLIEQYWLEWPKWWEETNVRL